MADEVAVKSGEVADESTETKRIEMTVDVSDAGPARSMFACKFLRAK